MGTAVTAVCTCGVTAQILVGGGMATFETTCYFPGSCRSCRSVVQINMLARECQCPECEARDVIPYDDARLARAPGQRVVAQWRGLVLTDGDYECPSCGMPSLRFSDGGMLWD